MLQDGEVSAIDRGDDAVEDRQDLTGARDTDNRVVATTTDHILCLIDGEICEREISEPDQIGAVLEIGDHVRQGYGRRSHH